MRRVFQGKPTITVNMEWMAWWPTRPNTFWVEVGRRVRDRRVKRRDPEAVRKICAEVEGLKDWKNWRRPHGEY